MFAPWRSQNPVRKTWVSDYWKIIHCMRIALQIWFLVASHYGVLNSTPGGGGYSREFWIGVCREGS